MITLRPPRIRDGIQFMIDKLSQSLHFQQEALNLRNERQQVLAGNIANADTPHYKARDFDFSHALGRAVDAGRSSQGLALSATSERHVPGAMADRVTADQLLYRVPDQPSLDGNTVDMDRERAQFLDNAVRYEASLTMLNSYIQGLKSAMRSE